MKIISQKTYALTTGLILFLLGFAGFAFRTNFSLPNKYLIISLILGFWGIVAGVHKDNDKN